MNIPCTLCQHPNSNFYFADAKRIYYQCPSCYLVFATPESYLSDAQEKREYNLHENSINDAGYINFLNRLAKPLLKKIGNNKHGLDFGCGPTPVLAKMLEASGHRVATFDKFYQPDTSVLNQNYDFVTCTEAIEHFKAPANEWSLLSSLLKPAGTLGIMTKLVINQARFRQWHYKNDPTHVSFFSRETFEFLAQRDNLTLAFVADDVIFFTKQ